MEIKVKSHGTMEGVYINGAPQGITFHETDEFTLYPASIISVSKNRYTKHYFIGNKRVASRIGSGSFNNVYGMNGCNITAGQQDYAERLNQIESQKEDYYRELGIAPGIPTMKGSYGDPENTGVGYNTIIRNLGDHSVPAEWAEYVKKNEQKDAAPGAPIAWDKPTQPEEVQPGYGYVADNNVTEETFYYHSDHLGSTSYVTDDSARITQYTAYLPYGELLVDEHSSSEDMPYKFNGKEFDEETGLYYYGARYMQPITSVWYGIDPLTEKYPNVSGYVYCAGNPVNMIDPDGNAGVKIVNHENKTVTIKADYFVIMGDFKYKKNGKIKSLSGYSAKEVNTMVGYNKYLNKLKLKVPSGKYKGYTIKFDLGFIGVETPITALACADNDRYGEYSIGNTFQRGSKYTHKNVRFEEKKNEDGTTETVGGITQENFQILMNIQGDSEMNRIHEIFHTLGLDHPDGGGDQGIMKYPPETPTKQDALELINNEYLPTLIEE